MICYLLSSNFPFLKNQESINALSANGTQVEAIITIFVFSTPPTNSAFEQQNIQAVIP